MTYFNVVDFIYRFSLNLVPSSPTRSPGGPRSSVLKTLVLWAHSCGETRLSGLLLWQWCVCVCDRRDLRRTESLSIAVILHTHSQTLCGRMTLFTSQGQTSVESRAHYASPLWCTSTLLITSPDRSNTLLWVLTQTRRWLKRTGFQTQTRTARTLAC